MLSRTRQNLQRLAASRGAPARRRLESRQRPLGRRSRSTAGRLTLRDVRMARDLRPVRRRRLPLGGFFLYLCWPVGQAVSPASRLAGPRALANLPSLKKRLGPVHPMVLPLLRILFLRHLAPNLPARSARRRPQAWSDPQRPSPALRRMRLPLRRLSAAPFGPPLGNHSRPPLP